MISGFSKVLFLKIRNRKLSSPFTIFTILVTGLIVFGQVFSFPSDVRDIIHNEFLEEAGLVYPVSYTIFAPFFQFADHLTILSLKQLIVFLIYVHIIWFIIYIVRSSNFRYQLKDILVAIGHYLLFIIMFAAVLAVIILIPRPMARLVIENENALIVDFHSHTNYSWDARKNFTPYKNLLWHSKTGYHAVFITDHNVFEGAEEGRTLSLEGRAPNGIVSMRGEEVSLYQSHWVLIGIDQVLKNSVYDTGKKGLESYLKITQKDSQSINVAYLPEYWTNHTQNERNEYVEWGADGFEIANAAPIGLDFTVESRSKMIEYCRKNNLIMTAGTDNHGWGYTNYAWNVLNIQNWKNIPKDELEKKVIINMKSKGANAVQILARVKREPRDNSLWLTIDPFLQLWEGARSLPLSHAVFSIFWVWGVWLVRLWRVTI